ncbi:MAG TPA: site-2 protease family protein [Chthoniobacterales bacterium]|nr:site-2 protease family protein [Chthoniobacterales bacterium]
MILQVIRVIFILLEVLVLFNLLIVVHEIGHFLAARWRGLFIEKFGIWFGKPLWKKTINGVQYSLGSLPFGGFVALPQLAPMDIIEGKADIDRAKLPKISALDKIIVAFAGPLFSFLLAVVFAVIIWAVGRPVSESEATTTVGYVVPDYPAAKAGLMAGDKILSVDHHRVTRFGGMSDDSIQWRVVRSEADTISITVERLVNGQAETKTFEVRPIVPPTKPWMRKGFREVGILPAETPVIAKVDPKGPAARAGLRPNDKIIAINGKPLYEIIGIAEYLRDHPNEPVTLTVERNRAPVQLPFEPGDAKIEAVSKDSPAERAGLRPGDVVLAVDGRVTKSTLAFAEVIEAHAGKPVTISILRDGMRRDLQVTPEIPQDEAVARIGISWADQFGITLDQYGNMTVKHPPPAEQIRAGVLSIVNTIGAVASPKSDVKLQHMSGPVMMLRVYYVMFENREGWRMALWFSVVLNINLALLNLLPIPVLDGGHILLALVEGVRRRPVNMRVLEVVQTVCAVLIIGFMVYIAFFDVQDLPIFGHRDAPRFLPKSQVPKSTQE